MFNKPHFINLLGYLGIGFISGALSHGFFTGTRSLIYVAIGIILFLISEYYSKESKNRKELLLFVVIYSLAVGMVSGGLQHFLDSPMRSVWIVPVGYFISLLIFPLKYPQDKINRTKSLGLGFLISLGLYAGLYGAINILPQSLFMGDHHGQANSGNHEDGENHHETEMKTRNNFSNDEKLNIHLCLMDGGENCVEILNPQDKNMYADAIKEQCEIMPGMKTCDEYFGIVSPSPLTGQQYDTQSSGSFQSVKNPEIKVLRNGDRFDLSLDNVNRRIGNSEIRGMGYNGSIPGPLIKVRQGDEITLKVTNNIADIESTVHHHGLRLDHRYDGVPQSMGGFDVPMKKGNSLEYKLKFPDAGLFWYHPHVREDFQQEMGLYGNYLVVPKDTGYRNPVDQEELLMLDDIQMSGDNVNPFYKEITNQAIMGRFGNHFLINGQENYKLTLKAGQVTRLYITNSANVRPFNINIPGLKIKLVGGDIGAYEKESFIDNLLIAPAERYIIEIAPEQSGNYEIVYKNPAFTTTIGTIEVVSNNQLSDSFKTFNLITGNLITIQNIDGYRKYFDKEIDKTLTIDMTLHGKTSKDMSLKMPHPHGSGDAVMGGLNYDLSKIERNDEMFEMNLGSTDKNTVWKLIDTATKQENMNIHRSFKQGDIVKVRIINDGEGMHPMQHPIHFHGQRFLVLNKNGIPNTNLVWKDTVLTLPGEYVDLLIDMSNPGGWMAHCHISEHMHAGMMMHFEVRDGEIEEKNIHNH